MNYELVWLVPALCPWRLSRIAIAMAMLALGIVSDTSYRDDRHRKNDVA